MESEYLFPFTLLLRLRMRRAHPCLLSFALRRIRKHICGLLEKRREGLV